MFAAEFEVTDVTIYNFNKDTNEYSEPTDQDLTDSEFTENSTELRCKGVLKEIEYTVEITPDNV